MVQAMKFPHLSDYDLSFFWPKFCKAHHCFLPDKYITSAVPHKVVNDP